MVSKCFTYMVLSIVVFSVAPAWAETVEPDEPDQTLWLSNDAIMVGVSSVPQVAAVGALLELCRFRFDVWQLTLLRVSGGAMKNADGTVDLAVALGLGGIGVHWPISSDGQHEWGLTFFPAAGHIVSAHSDRHEAEYEGVSVTRGRERTTIGFGTLQIFYRWSNPSWHLEVAVDSSPVWRVDTAYTWECDGGVWLMCAEYDPQYDKYKSKEDQEWFGGLPPVTLSVGVGF